MMSCFDLKKTFILSHLCLSALEGCAWILGKGRLWVRQIVLTNVIYL